MVNNIYCLELMFILLNIVQQQKLMKKVILIETLFLKKKDKRHQKKKLNCTFIRINTSRENFDADYEASEIQAFISQFKDNEIKERDNKNKELEDKIKEKDNKNKELKDEIKEKDNKNKELEDEIKKIKATVSKFGYKK